MKVTKENLPDSCVELKIEVDDERLERAMKSAFKRLASQVKIPGFRPGKAPRAVLERHVGERAILYEAIDQLMPQVYGEALDQEEIEPVGQADYELITEEPLVAKFIVPVRPTVDLGDYTSLRVPTEAVAIEPERVQDNLEALRHRYATFEPVDRPTQWGDIIRADVEGTVNGNAIVREEDVEFQLQEGRTISLPGVAEQLIDREKGGEFEFEVKVPEDAPDERVRGSQAHYRVRIKEAKQEILPELDDEFARQVGEGFSDLTALRTRIEEDMRQALEAEAEHQYHDRILEALADRAQLDYPPILIDREVERLMREQSGGPPQVSGRSDPRRRTASAGELERYLERVGKSEDELRAEMRPVAERRVRRSLVLSQVTEAEDIHVTDGEVEAEISRIASGVGEQGEEVRRLFSDESARESMRRSLLTKKTLERLAQIAATDGATSEEAQASAPGNG